MDPLIQSFEQARRIVICYSRTSLSGSMSEVCAVVSQILEACPKSARSFRRFGKRVRSLRGRFADSGSMSDVCAVVSQIREASPEPPTSFPKQKIRQTEPGDEFLTILACSELL